METNIELRVATDIGGTFTDVVVYDPRHRRYSTAKAPSQVDDLAAGVMDALGLVVGEPGGGGVLRPRVPLWGSTPSCRGAGKGSSCWLRPAPAMSITSPAATASTCTTSATENPPPSLPRRDIIPIGGRLDYEGAELTPLDHDDLRRAAERIRSEGVRSVAIAFLFSYLNPDHELAAAAALGEMAPGVSLSLSHQVATEWREYERTASAVMDAYIAPSVSRYMADLSTRLGDQGMSAPLLVMQSNGGVISAQAASERPLQTLLSGPVGGAAGGVALSEVLDRPNLICIDLGGTSFDVSLITDGQADSSPSALLEGLPVLMPVVDIHTIGAGRGLTRLPAGRRPSGGTGKRRRPPRPGLLWAGRDPTHRDRRQPGAGPHRSRLFPGR